MENMCGLKAILRELDQPEVHIPVPLTAVDITARLVNFTAEVCIF
jgi:hypothetical protein